MKRTLFYITVCILFSTPLLADDGKELFELIDENALEVHIVARVYQDDHLSTVWDMEITRFTILGRSVNITLTGENIRVRANITPYSSGTKGLILLTQGEVWISPKEADKVQYLSTLKSIPIMPGEKVLFYPLGVQKRNKKTKEAPIIIELEIQVVHPKKEDKPAREGPRNKPEMYKQEVQYRGNIVSQAIRK